VGSQLGVDIGGTFMDFVLADETGAVRISKVPSRHAELEQHFFDGIEAFDVPLSEIDALLHGTTIAINTIVQRRGARVGLLTTTGFRDSLEICRGTRKEIYDIYFRNPEPLVRRRLRREVDERLDFEGNVVRELDQQQACGEIEFLRDEGCDVIAVALLHAYRNGAHELAVGRLIEEVAPGVTYFLSHQVAPEWREYERTSTVVLNGYVAPQVGRYLDTLEGGLNQRGYEKPLTIIQSTGGSTSADAGRTLPIRTLESGPAGGVGAAAILARAIRRQRVIAADVGGTTFDVSLVVDGRPSEKSQTEIGYRPVLAPTLDIVSIGAGGGSIAWLDAGGGLQVGPQSAQADPGPACFGRGGIDPTVTDAYAVLGVLDPDYFLGSKMRLDLEAARQALATVGDSLGLDVEETADAVVRLASMNMVLAIRNITIERGHDPRTFSLLAYGGGGGMFAALIARELEVSEVIVPRLPANFSAWGIVNSDFRYDDVTHVLGGVDKQLLQRAKTALQEMEARGRDALRAWGHSDDGAVLAAWLLDVRYVGQEHTIRVPIKTGSPLEPDAVRTLFEELHHFHYAHAYETQPIELVNCRVTVTGIRPKAASTVSDAADGADPVKGIRSIHVPAVGRTEATVLDRECLRPGDSWSGPALVEEWTSTTLIPPGSTLNVDELGNLDISLH
jgi:N-methylhydantoinase A